jgi:putative two-component system response regulator
MKQIIVACHDYGTYQEIEQRLKACYQVSPLLEDVGLLDTTRPAQPDLILLMTEASDTDSLKTLESIMRIPEMLGTPVIFLAKSGDGEQERKALDAGAYDYITMPVSTELLLHRISSCLELMELRKEQPFIRKYQDAISCCFAELVECRDVTTGGHLKNTTRYFNVLLQEAMKSGKYKDLLLAEDARDLLRSVTLHDIGKIGINDDVLRKESTLDLNEFEYMKTHTTLGKQAFENIIKETGGTRWLYLAKDMAYCHHERWDGTGYPNGLKGEEIPLCARLLTVADVYDALTSNRAYKKAFSHEKAMEIILEGKGSIFDPELVELFVNVNDQFEEILNNKYDIDLIEKE